MLQTIALAELVLCVVAWSLAFVKPGKKAATQKKVVSAPLSRWGILLQLLGIALVSAYVRPVGFEKSAAALMASMVLGLHRSHLPGQPLAILASNGRTKPPLPRITN